MDPEFGPTTAGILSTFLFASSNIPMLVKAFRTRDLKSYSPLYLGISNIGNLIHWYYIISLPFGPIWFLHAFFTIACLLMLLLYLRYEGPQIIRKVRMGVYKRMKESAEGWRTLEGWLKDAWEQACICGEFCRCLQVFLGVLEAAPA